MMLPNDHIRSVVASGFDFIIVNIASNYRMVDPEMTRRVEILEVLMFSFIEHAIDLDSLDEIESRLSPNPNKEYLQ